LGTRGTTGIRRVERVLVRGREEVKLERSIAAREERTEVGFYSRHGE
jgi:hypothetical protein